MAVRVRLSFQLQEFTGGREYVESSGTTPVECLRDLELRFPGIKRWLYDKWGDIRPQFQFFVNGVRIFAGEMNQPLKNDDELYILVAVGGG
ncbi:MAG: MoaD/ThiS family protein [Dehalococcoidia bacterium]|nr:MoaD/ThiS family protein [Dehalococcoidia bacterium]